MLKAGYPSILVRQIENTLEFSDKGIVASEIKPRASIA